MTNEYHVPVLLNKSIEGLSIVEGGIYADATFGGGGHSGEILKRLTSGHLYAFDQDEDAAKNIPASKNFTLIRSNFRNLKSALNENGVVQIDGLLADLGVSSHQFDTSSRGFSIRFDAPLDMRMDKTNPVTAASVLNEYDEQELKKILKSYGEIEHAGRVAGKIVETARKGKLQSTNQLIEVLRGFTGRGKENQFYAQVFQALRIEVNDEINALKDLLQQSTGMIKKGGRLVVISYHSLEDRLVKNFMRSGNFKGEVEKDLYGNTIAPLSPVTRKPIEAEEEEIELNPRSRSAKLRIAEKKLSEKIN